MVFLMWTIIGLFAFVFLTWLFIQFIEIQINSTVSGDERSLAGIISFVDIREPSPLVLMTIIPRFKKFKKRLFSFSIKIELHNMLRFMDSPTYKRFYRKYPWLQIMPADLLPLTSKMKISEFKVNASVGVGDCAGTAIMCGVCYSVFGSVAAIFANSFKSFDEISVVANPDYQKIGFNYELACILHANLADIINGFIKTFYKKFKGRCKKC